ncbi:unnamed protein product [Tetraodon nigroviridis]|uniref:(spotted green pufferfish) hypothetical protein n=1 Tax=Tetraodon nigroviridis TaxID=99883 RepID=Q4RIW0_TETNG|nr:unnamed protein product [Tetraodon nigroviridis]
MRPGDAARPSGAPRRRLARLQLLQQHLSAPEMHGRSEVSGRAHWNRETGQVSLCCVQKVRRSKGLPARRQLQTHVHGPERIPASAAAEGCLDAVASADTLKQACSSRSKGTSRGTQRLQEFRFWGSWGWSMDPQLLPPPGQNLQLQRPSGTIGDELAQMFVPLWDLWELWDGGQVPVLVQSEPRPSFDPPGHWRLGNASMTAPSLLLSTAACSRHLRVPSISQLRLSSFKWLSQTDQNRRGRVSCRATGTRGGRLAVVPSVSLPLALLASALFQGPP